MRGKISQKAYNKRFCVYYTISYVASQTKVHKLKKDFWYIFSYMYEITASC